jgi:hypothetical protein
MFKTKHPSKKIIAVKPDKWGKAALAGCRWFVRTQTRSVPPDDDANRGRYIYNVYLPGLKATHGLVWTQARAVMCLLTAWERTGKPEYLQSAEEGIFSIKILQGMDRRKHLTFGAFYEETLHSTFSYPRDACEGAEALLHWHRATGDADSLYRAELFFKWIEREAIRVYPEFGWWIAGRVNFTGQPAPDTHPLSCESGCGTIFAHAYDITGNRKYRNWSVKTADQILKRYCPADTGPMKDNTSGKKKKDHHSDAVGTIFNDDGAGVSLLNAYRLTRGQEYLEAAIRVADYFTAHWQKNPLFSGLGSIANFLLETDAIRKQDGYRVAAEDIGRRILKLQMSSAHPMRGGFRGEDEDVSSYHGGSKTDYITTRVTAYSALTLFKLEGLVWPYGYSARPLDK